jgi:HEAT repeat protein
MRKLWLISGLAIMLLGCGRRESTADWMDKLHSQDSATRLHAVKALGEKRTEANTVVPALAEALRDQDPFVRREAANSLGRIGTDARSAVPALVSAMQDTQPKVRQAASQALKQIDPEAAAKANLRKT